MYRSLAKYQALGSTFVGGKVKESREFSGVITTEKDSKRLNNSRCYGSVNRNDLQRVHLSWCGKGPAVGRPGTHPKNMIFRAQRPPFVSSGRFRARTTCTGVPL